MHPKLIIHGGIGSARAFERGTGKARQSLERIVAEAYQFLQDHSAVETVIHAVSLLEDDPVFNAGTGSKLQSDGTIRMTASVMDGEKKTFAGIINIQNVRNPVQVAAKLLGAEDRVLSGKMAGEFARLAGFAEYNPETPERRQAFEQKVKGKTGTVGCVAIDKHGHLASATSTGGKGFEVPGRVSDSATVAGNYADRSAAVSCTGIGEDIVNAALAAKIVTRVGDGMSLPFACEKTIGEMRALDGNAGLIAVDAAGNLYQCATDPYLTFACHDGKITLF